ncbi:MAG: MFS transporter [Candidatus Xenobia bacterium]
MGSETVPLETPAPSMHGGSAREYMHVLTHCPEFVRLWIAQMIAMAGDWFTTVAVMGLVLDLTQSRLAASLVLLSNTLPTFLITPLSGVLADRFNRKAIIVFCNVTSSIAVLSFLLVDRPGRVWICYAATAVLVMLGACIVSAATAGVPTLVGREHLVAANALFGVTWGLMLAVGAAAGGYVAAKLGRPTAFIIDSIALFLTGLLVLSIKRADLRPSGEPHPHHRAGGVTFAAALAHLRQYPGQFLIVLAKTAWGLGGGILVLLSVFPKQIFGAGDEGIGLLYSFRGIGSLLGPLLALLVVRNKVSRMPGAITVSLISCGAFYVMFSESPDMAWASWAVLLAHLGAGAIWVVSSTLLQLYVPNHMMGRISAIDLGAVTLAMAASQLLTGIWADHASPRLVGLACGLLTLLAGIAWAVLWHFFRPRLRPPAEHE